MPSKTSDQPSGINGLIRPRVVVDIGGSTFRIAVAGENGKLCKFKMDSHQLSCENATPEDFCHYVANQLKEYTEICAQQKTLRIVVAAPVSGDHRVIRIFTNIFGNQHLDIPFSEMMESALQMQGLKVKIYSDIVPQTLAEMSSFGAASDHKTVYGINVGTGVISIPLERLPTEDIRIIPGHWESGHTLFDGKSNISCACGLNGCVEACAAGPKIIEWLHNNRQEVEIKKSRAYMSSPLMKHKRVTSEDLVKSIRAGDPFALHVLEYGTRAIADMASRFLHNFRHDDIKIVIVGGFARSIGERYKKSIVAHIVKNGFAFLDHLCGEKDLKTFVKKRVVMGKTNPNHTNLIGARLLPVYMKEER